MLPAASAEPAAPPKLLKVGVAQLALEPTLEASRDKIVRFVGEAKDRDCRVVVFPETSLYWPPQTLKGEIDAAVEVVRKAVDAADMYALVGGPYKRDEMEKPFERLLVIDPEGRILQSYNKMWGDARFNDCPGMFQIDGVPCCAAICADRWIRSVEELPAMAGAKVLFEVSNNYDNEWLPDLGWFWYVPRAVRNEAFVVFANTGKDDRAQNTPGHGHTAFIGPDGAILAAAGEESDRLVVAELDLSKATGSEATARRRHPALAPFWDTGVKMLAGEKVAATKHEVLVSPEVEIKIAAGQMACSRDVDENVSRIEKMIREAKTGGADVVVFPELAVTGAREEDVAAASGEQLAGAMARIQEAATASQIYVVFGTPWLEGGKRQNCAVAISPDGRILTRYGQLVVDRPSLFVAGTSTRAMWFEIKGAPCVVTVGRDAQWSEIAEMAAWRGAQVHLHLAYDLDPSAEGLLKRKQVWANLASFRTFTATVNAASPAGLARPSAVASGGSAIWDDYHRGQNRQAGGYGPYSAVRVTEAKEGETILFATQKTQKVNPQYGILTGRSNRSMTPWYTAGAAAIFADGPLAASGNGTKRTNTTHETYFPKAEEEGAWRSLVKANEVATVEQKARVRELAGLDWDRLNEAWQYSKSFGGPSSMVVVRHGWIAGEWFTDTSKRGIASCTKSLTALSVAKLCELSAAGKFKKTVSFDEPAWKYLPPAWSEQEPQRKAILLRHMLTMSSGLDPYDGPYSDLQAYGDIILTRHVEAEPGKVWAYASAPVDLLSLVVQDVSGQLMGDFFNEQIGRPIGCAAVEFPKFREYSGGSGGPQGGVRVATRDLARLGYLLLHDGQWRDEAGEKQIFSRETVDRITRWAPELESATCRAVQLGSPGKEGAQLDYGHLFWTNRTQVRLGKAVPADAFYMSGWGKQICCVIPSLDMVIVRLGPKRELNEVQEYYAEFLSRIISAVEKQEER